MIYRGHSDIDWLLIPSAFRNSNHIKNERLYLRILRQLPNETDNLDYFDVLVKAQHYGIPTRLLTYIKPVNSTILACLLMKIGWSGYLHTNQALFSARFKYKVLMHYIFRFKHDIVIDKNTELPTILIKGSKVFEEVNSK